MCPLAAGVHDASLLALVLLLHAGPVGGVHLDQPDPPGVGHLELEQLVQDVVIAVEDGHLLGHDTEGLEAGELLEELITGGLLGDEPEVIPDVDWLLLVLVFALGQGVQLLLLGQNVLEEDDGTEDAINDDLKNVVLIP